MPNSPDRRSGKPAGSAAPFPQTVANGKPIHRGAEYQPPDATFRFIRGRLVRFEDGTIVALGQAFLRAAPPYLLSAEERDAAIHVHDRRDDTSSWFCVDQDEQWLEYKHVPAAAQFEEEKKEEVGERPFSPLYAYIGQTFEDGILSIAAQGIRIENACYAHAQAIDHRTNSGLRILKQPGRSLIFVVSGRKVIRRLYFYPPLMSLFSFFVDSDGIYEVLENRGVSATGVKSDPIQPVFDYLTHPVVAWICLLLVIGSAVFNSAFCSVFFVVGALSRLCAMFFRCSRLDPFWPSSHHPVFPEDQRQ